MNRISLIPSKLSLISTRGAKAVQSGTYYRNMKPLRSNMKLKGAFVGDGEPVRRGEIIWNEVSNNNTQWSCMPGANAEVVYNRGFAPQLVEGGIYAQCDGTVRYTREIFVPTPDSVEARNITKMPVGAFIYKLHCHVVPEKQTNEFRMKSFI